MAKEWHSHPFSHTKLTPKSCLVCGAPEGAPQHLGPFEQGLKMPESEWNIYEVHSRDNRQT